MSFYIQILLFVFLIANPSYAYTDGPHAFSDSGIEGLSYKQVIEDLESLQAENVDISTMISLGFTREGREIKGILISSEEVPKQLTVITGAIHGNEYLNIADRLPGAFLDKDQSTFQKYIKSGGAIFVLPIQNPDGYDNDRRFSYGFTDLNRTFPNPANDYKPFNEKHVETKALAEWVQLFVDLTGAQFTFSLDYHCCQGSMLFPWAWSRRATLPESDYQIFDNFGQLMLQYFPDHIYGPVPRVIGYTAIGSSMDYWYEKYGTYAIAFEGEYKKAAEDFSSHVAWLSDILATMVD